MFIVRPVHEGDLEALERFANETTLGMLSLPRNRELLKKKIAKSLASFSKAVSSPQDEFYLFVLENPVHRDVEGCCGIYSRTGVHEPIYYFRLETLHPNQTDLPVPKDLKVLHPEKMVDGPSELCSLYASRKIRKERYGELLSRCRYLFIAQNPERFTEKMYARLRGVVNREHASSPFWSGYGRYFLDMSFEEVEILHQKGTAFIEKFLPKYPIYATLLAPAAQEVIQKTLDTTQPALNMLLQEGFTYTDQVDLFEAGPVVEADKHSIRSIKNNQVATIHQISDSSDHSKDCLISNTSLDFRACYGSVEIGANGAVVLSSQIAAALKVGIGDKVRFVRRDNGSARDI